MKIAELITEQLTPIFGGFIVPVTTVEKYIEAIEGFVN